MNIDIKVVTHDQMRPNVHGADWYFEIRDGVETLVVRIEPMANWKYEALLQMHEAFEAILCKASGVTVEQVDKFDTQYDLTHPIDCNAGDDPEAPYRREHTYATAVERIMAGAMNVCWDTYDRDLCTRYPGPSHKRETTV